MAEPDFVIIGSDRPVHRLPKPGVAEQLALYAGGRIGLVQLSSSAGDTDSAPRHRDVVTRLQVDDTVFQPDPPFGLRTLGRGMRAKRQARKQIVSAIRQAISGAKACVVSDPLDLSWLVPALKSDLRIPVVFLAASDQVSRLFVSVGGARRRRDLARADHAVAVSRFLHGFLLRKLRFDEADTSHIPLGAPPVLRLGQAERMSVRRRFGLAEGARLVIAVPPLGAHAGTDHLLRAWPSVTTVAPNASLVIAGGGRQLARLRDQAQDLTSVAFLPDLKNDSIRQVMAASDLFARPNRRAADGTDSATGRSFVRAAAAGLPMVGGLSGAAPAIVRDHGLGLCVDGQLPDQISTALLRLLTAPDRLNDLREKACAFAASCTEEDTSAQFLSCLDLLVGQFSRGRA